MTKFSYGKRLFPVMCWATSQAREMLPNCRPGTTRPFGCGIRFCKIKDEVVTLMVFSIPDGNQKPFRPGYLGCGGVAGVSVSIPDGNQKPLRPWTYDYPCGKRR